jgi:hypothetical protein
MRSAPASSPSLRYRPKLPAASASRVRAPALAPPAPHRQGLPATPSSSPCLRAASAEHRALRRWQPIGPPDRRTPCQPRPRRTRRPPLARAGRVEGGKVDGLAEGAATHGPDRQLMRRPGQQAPDRLREGQALDPVRPGRRSFPLSPSSNRKPPSRRYTSRAPCSVACHTAARAEHQSGRSATGSQSCAVWARWLARCVSRRIRTPPGLGRRLSTSLVRCG